MDFKQLEAFTVLAQERHFARTAQRLHMTASTLTRLMQRLEQELDTQLLIRSNRSVELTPAGREFDSYAKEALEKQQSIKRRLSHQSSNISGQLKIYSSVTASFGLLSQLLKDFRQNFPNVDLKLHTGDQAQAIARVLNGDEDISIAALPELLPESLVFKTLTFSSLCFIAPAEHGVLQEQIMAFNAAPSAKAFAQLPLIISEQGLARERLSDWFKRNHVSPNIYAEVSGHEAIVSMVALGMGVGLVPEIVVQHSPLQGKIVLLETAPELQAFQIGLCVLKNRLEKPAVNAFFQAAKPHVAKV